MIWIMNWFFSDDKIIIVTAYASDESSSLPLVSLETVKFGRSQFPYNGTIVLADVLSPSLRIVGGQVILNLPPTNDVKLVAAQITNAGIEHAVIVPLINIFDQRQKQMRACTVPTSNSYLMVPTLSQAMQILYQQLQIFCYGMLILEVYHLMMIMVLQ